MKIAILTNEYPPHIYGGAGVHVEYLSKELAHLEGGKHEVNVYCFDGQKEHSGHITVEGIRLDFDFPSQDVRHRKLLDTLFRNILIVGSLKEADIVHCHTWYTHLAGCLIKQMLNIPLVLTIHSLEPHRSWKEEQMGSTYKASTWLEKTAYENADGVIATSQSMKTAAHNLYKVPLEKVRIIPNGIDANQYKPTLNPALLASYGINPEKPFLLFVGRITRQKGIIHLINAIKYLLPGIQAVLCAGAPDTKEIGEEIAEKVEKVRNETANDVIWIQQWVPRAHLITLYSHASVFICPSIYEPFGIINLEAMACGTPVVASAVGGIPEVVVRGETGLLVPFEPISDGNFEPKNPGQFSKDLAEAVNSLFSSSEKIRTMGWESRKRVEKDFSWESVARQTIGFYRELTSPCQRE
ncbi:MAG: glycosyl transferase family 1 [Deltaproteobacteria bacterium RBG_16_47_11]|nr:MAG: glycosyl transferase family 1 [Deltaproteobacteria bacterium RBG_16_47_11]